MSTKRNALGKGLSALLESNSTDVTTMETPMRVGSVSEIKIADIEANPFQPRTEFAEADLQELADSIIVHGIIQPITVRKMGYDKFQIISGERRTRAAVLAGLTSIAAYIRIANDEQSLEMALIENTHRKDLNAIEIALSYKRLLDECSLKQEELGEKVGKDRTTVNNYLRLLRLPEDIQAALRDERLSMGHARAIINIENPEKQRAIFEEIINGNLSVRKVEDLVRERGASKKNTNSTVASTDEFVSEFESYQHTLSKRYSSLVNFRLKPNGKGEIVIPFHGRNELQRLINLLEN
ncbi:MAG: ParB/RepB/Spo0J family partition protein [Bacteroidota bacterium]|nr:ParB/RepB/Spo0J family partition protein [Bacteroidota bacterium]